MVTGYPLDASYLYILWYTGNQRHEMATRFPWIEVLAERMAMSPRNFARVFQTETGMSPAKFVEKARIDVARHFLGVSDYPIETVAVVSGFGDAERMRKAFRAIWVYQPPGLSCAVHPA